MQPSTLASKKPTSSSSRSMHIQHADMSSCVPARVEPAPDGVNSKADRPNHRARNCPMHVLHADQSRSATPFGASHGQARELEKCATEATPGPVMSTQSSSRKKRGLIRQENRYNSANVDRDPHVGLVSSQRYFTLGCHEAALWTLRARAANPHTGGPIRGPLPWGLPKEWDSNGVSQGRTKGPGGSRRQRATQRRNLCVPVGLHGQARGHS